MRRGTIAALATAALVVACQPAPLTDADRAAIEDEITQLYVEQDAALDAGDAEAWLAFFDPGEDFLMAVGGELMDYGVMEASARDWFTGQTEIQNRWLENHVQVLSRDIAIVTSLWDWSSRDADGELEEAAGTWTVVLVKKDGAWKIVNASETLPEDEDDGDGGEMEG